MKRQGSILFVLLAVALASGGCFQEPTGGDFGLSATSSELCNACLKAAPDPDSLEVTIPENDKGYAKGFAKESELGGLPEYYDLTVDVSRSLNFWILGMLGQLDEILTYPPTQTDDDTCFWGPFIPNGLSPVEVRFQMSKVSDSDYDYVWEHRPKNTDEKFTPIWGGAITPATDTARRGVGTMFMDFTEAKRLDPTWNATGRMDVEYDTYSDGRLIDITFTDWDSEGLGVPTDGAYHYHNHADNRGEFSFALGAEFSPGDSPESWAVTTQWESDGTGISVSTISGGDLDGLSYQGTECWDSLFRLTYYNYRLNEGGNLVSEDEAGDEAACPTFL